MFVEFFVFQSKFRSHSKCKPRTLVDVAAESMNCNSIQLWPLQSRHWLWKAKKKTNLPIRWPSVLASESPLDLRFSDSDWFPSSRAIGRLRWPTGDAAAPRSLFFPRRRRPFLFSGRIVRVAAVVSCLPPWNRLVWSFHVSSFYFSFFLSFSPSSWGPVPAPSRSLSSTGPKYF